MEAFLDILAAFLCVRVATTPALTWILGDPGMSAPSTLPFGYIIPRLDKVLPRSGGLGGVDMDTYTVPILVVDDLHRYGPPVQTPGQAYFEQPGYRKLLGYGQAVRGALRGPSGAGIVLGGAIATSAIPEISYVWAVIDDKPYRGVRLTVTAQQRRSRV